MPVSLSGIIHRSQVIPCLLKSWKRQLPHCLAFRWAQEFFAESTNALSFSLSVFPMNNIFIDEYYWYSNSIERNDWHIITLLTHYSQVSCKEAERRHQKNVHRLPTFLSLPPADRARSFSPTYTPLRSLFTDYDEVATSRRSILSSG